MLLTLASVLGALAPGVQAHAMRQPLFAVTCASTIALCNARPMPMNHPVDDRSGFAWIRRSAGALAHNASNANATQVRGNYPHAEDNCPVFWNIQQKYFFMFDRNYLTFVFGLTLIGVTYAILKWECFIPPDTKKKTRMTFLALAFAAILVREMHIIAYGEYYVNTVVNNGQRHPRMSLALNFASHGLFAIFIADFIYFYSPVVKKGLKLPSKCNHKLCVHHARRFTIFLLGLAILLPWFLFVASWIALDEYDVVGKDQNEKWARGLLAFSKFALAWAVHNWIAHAHAEDQQDSHTNDLIIYAMAVMLTRFIAFFVDMLYDMKSDDPLERQPEVELLLHTMLEWAPWLFFASMVCKYNLVHAECKRLRIKHSTRWSKGRVVFGVIFGFSTTALITYIIFGTASRFSLIYTATLIAALFGGVSFGWWQPVESVSGVDPACPVRHPSFIETFFFGAYDTAEWLILRLCVCWLHLERLNFHWAVMIAIVAGLSVSALDDSNLWVVGAATPLVLIQSFTFAAQYTTDWSVRRRGNRVRGKKGKLPRVSVHGAMSAACLTLSFVFWPVSVIFWDVKDLNIFQCGALSLLFGAGTALLSHWLIPPATRLNNRLCGRTGRAGTRPAATAATTAVRGPSAYDAVMASPPTGPPSPVPGPAAAPGAAVPDEHEPLLGASISSPTLAQSAYYTVRKATSPTPVGPTGMLSCRSDCTTLALRPQPDNAANEQTHFRLVLVDRTAMLGRLEKVVSQVVMEGTDNPTRKVQGTGWYLEVSEFQNDLQKTRSQWIQNFVEIEDAANQIKKLAKPKEPRSLQADEAEISPSVDAAKNLWRVAMDIARRHDPGGCDDTISDAALQLLDLWVRNPSKKSTPGNGSTTRNTPVVLGHDGHLWRFTPDQNCDGAFFVQHVHDDDGIEPFLCEKESQVVVSYRGTRNSWYFGSPNPVSQNKTTARTTDEEWAHKGNELVADWRSILTQVLIWIWMALLFLWGIRKACDNSLGDDGWTVGMARGAAMPLRWIPPLIFLSISYPILQRWWFAIVPKSSGEIVQFHRTFYYNCVFYATIHGLGHVLMWGRHELHEDKMNLSNDTAHYLDSVTHMRPPASVPWLTGIFAYACLLATQVTYELFGKGNGRFTVIFRLLHIFFASGFAVLLLVHSCTEVLGSWQLQYTFLAILLIMAWSKFLDWRLTWNVPALHTHVAEWPVSMDVPEHGGDLLAVEHTCSRHRMYDFGPKPSTIFLYRFFPVDRTKVFGCLPDTILCCSWLLDYLCVDCNTVPVQFNPRPGSYIHLWVPNSRHTILRQERHPFSLVSVRMTFRNFMALIKHQIQQSQWLVVPKPEVLATCCYIPTDLLMVPLANGGQPPVQTAVLKYSGKFCKTGLKDDFHGVWTKVDFDLEKDGDPVAIDRCRMFLDELANCTELVDVFEVHMLARENPVTGTVADGVQSWVSHFATMFTEKTAVQNSVNVAGDYRSTLCDSNLTAADGVVLVGGSVGIASMLSLASHLLDRGRKCTVILRSNDTGYTEYVRQTLLAMGDTNLCESATFANPTGEAVDWTKTSSTTLTITRGDGEVTLKCCCGVDGRKTLYAEVARSIDETGDVGGSTGDRTVAVAVCGSPSLLEEIYKVVNGTTRPYVVEVFSEVFPRSDWKSMETKDIRLARKDKQI